jgi:signal transduction histidine kinase
LFLAFKESLNNVVKHAAATEVRVELKLEPSRLVLLVADNGRGFAADGKGVASPDRILRGSGLLNMKRRLADIGGLCEFQSEPGGGTSVRFFVPLRA